MVFKTKSLHGKLFFTIATLVTIFIIVTMFFIWFVSTSELRHRLDEEVLNSLEQIGKNVDMRTESVRRYINYIDNNNELKELLRTCNSSQNPTEVNDATINAQRILFNLFYGDNTVSSIYLFSNKKMVYSFGSSGVTGSDITQSEWYQKTMEKNGQLFHGGTYPNPDKTGIASKVYVVGAVIKSSDSFGRFTSPDGSSLGENLGSIYILIDEKTFGNIYRQVSVKRPGYIAIYDHEKRLISQDEEVRDGLALSEQSLSLVFNDSQGNQHLRSAGTDVVLSYYTTPVFGFKIIKTLQYSKYAGQIQKIWVFISFFGSLLYMVLMIAAYYVSKRITSPIKLLDTAINKIVAEHGENVNKKQVDEIERITAGFNTITKKLKDFITRIVEEERLRNEYELQALQYQINPHFLYNILSSIRLTALLHSDTVTANALKVLAGLLRRTISYTGSSVTVKEEMENIKDMICIYQLQYDTEFQVEYDLEPGIEEYTLPNMLLQPIVENAIAHGIGEEPEKGCIRITGKLDNDDVVFSISDNGAGMTAETVQKILECKTAKGGKLSHIGVMNVDNRIKLNYGPRYGLEIVSLPGVGTTVRIRIPRVKDEEHDQYGKEKDIIGR